MKPFKRSDRVGELIQQVLADVLRKKIKDPRLAITSITAVKMSSDLRHAKIYFSIAGVTENSRTEAMEGFQSAMGFFKRTLARELNLRYMPCLVFVYDESLEYGAHIDELLKSIKKTDGSSYSFLEE